MAAVAVASLLVGVNVNLQAGVVVVGDSHGTGTPVPNSWIAGVGEAAGVLGLAEGGSEEDSPEPRAGLWGRRNESTH